MSHEIEANFIEEWPNEASQCKKCTSFHGGYCSEARAMVSVTAHCDFFQSRD